MCWCAVKKLLTHSLRSDADLHFCSSPRIRVTVMNKDKLHKFTPLFDRHRMDVNYPTSTWVSNYPVRASLQCGDHYGHCIGPDREGSLSVNWKTKSWRARRMRLQQAPIWGSQHRFAPSLVKRTSWSVGRTLSLTTITRPRSAVISSRNVSLLPASVV